MSSPKIYSNEDVEALLHRLIEDVERELFKRIKTDPDTRQASLSQLDVLDVLEIELIKTVENYWND